MSNKTMEHLNARSFMYVAEFKKKSDNTLSFRKHNHFSCFGSFASVSRVPLGYAPTGRYSFSTNYGFNTAKRLLKAMREQNIVFDFGGVIYKCPKVTLHRAGTKGSGFMDEPALQKFHYYTVTFPKGFPAYGVYPVVKNLFKAICATQNSLWGTRFVDHWLDNGASFLEVCAMIGLANCGGGYRYPFNVTLYRGAYSRQELRKYLKGRIEFAEDTLLRTKRGSGIKAVQDMVGGDYLPVTEAPGLPTFRMSTLPEDQVHFDVNRLTAQPPAANGAKVYANDKAWALEFQTNFNKQVR